MTPNERFFWWITERHRIFEKKERGVNRDLWTDDEMIKDKVGIKTGKRMGHISMSGEEGSLNIFKDVKIDRKIFIHINTTNPALLNNSSERKVLENAGWEVAYDTMEIKI